MDSNSFNGRSWRLSVTLTAMALVCLAIAYQVVAQNRAPTTSEIIRRNEITRPHQTFVGFWRGLESFTSGWMLRTERPRNSPMMLKEHRVLGVIVYFTTISLLALLVLLLLERHQLLRTYPIPS